MLKEHDYVFKRVSIALDLALVAASVAASYWLRSYVLAPYFFPDLLYRPVSREESLWLFLGAPLLTVFFLHRNGFYQSQRLRRTSSLLPIIVGSTLLGTVFTVVMEFLVRQGQPLSDRNWASNLSRGIILLVPVIGTFALWTKTAIVRSLLMRFRDQGYNTRSLLLVGEGPNLEAFITLVREHPFWGFELSGVVTESQASAANNVLEVPVIGQLPDLLPYLNENPVDDVVFVPSHHSLADLEPYFFACEEMGVRTRLSLNFFRPVIARPVLDSYEGIPVVTYSPTRELNSALLFKYTFDRVAALVLLILLSPVILAIYLAIKLTSAGGSDPIFFGQKRCGLYGKTFTLWKFRSMRLEAEAMREELESKNEMTGPAFKIRNDPRVTTVGRWLRKSSMDELPQLYNVLLGDMSLVGPRPPLPHEVVKYDRWQRRRLSMKPGITGLWQVSGRNELSFEEWMRLDLKYIDEWSLALDSRILLKTIYVVATGYGAM